MVVGIEGQPFTEAGAHHLLVFPRNDAHTLASGPGLRPVSADDLIAGPGEDGLARIRHGGGGAACRILCGFLANRDHANPLIASLPSLMSLSVGDEQARQWIEGSIRYAARKQAVATGDGASGLARLAGRLPARETGFDIGPSGAGPRRAGRLKGRSRPGLSLEDSSPP